MPFWVCETALVSPSHSLPCLHLSPQTVLVLETLYCHIANLILPSHTCLCIESRHPRRSPADESLHCEILSLNAPWVHRIFSPEIVNHQNSLTAPLFGFAGSLTTLASGPTPWKKSALVKQRELIKVKNTVNTKHIITDFLPSDDKTVTHLLSFSLKWGLLTHSLPSIRLFAINVPGGTLLAWVSHERRANVNSKAHRTVNIWL